MVIAVLTQDLGNTLDGSLLPVWVFSILNLFDTLTTYWDIHFGGFETNLIYQWSGNMSLVSGAKWIAVLVVILVVYRLRVSKLLWVASLLPLYAVVNNIVVFIRR
jgi:hypothetical protein